LHLVKQWQLLNYVTVPGLTRAHQILITIQGKARQGKHH
jgi:hypothetical protein